MQTHHSCRLVAIIASFAITIPCAAQQTRSMVFETKDVSGHLIVLALQEAKFSDPDHDGMLSFVGQFVDGDEGAFELNFAVSASLLARIATDCTTSIDLGGSVLGSSTDMVWLGISEKKIEKQGVSISTEVVSTRETTNLAVIGDYSDVFALFGKGAIQSEIEVSIAQALGIILSGSAVAYGGRTPSFKECFDAANEMCAHSCVGSLSYMVAIDGVGCSFRCKSDCP